MRDAETFNHIHNHNQKRLRALVEEASAARMLKVFSRVTREIGTSLSQDKTVQNLLDILVPEIADEGAVWLPVDTHLRSVATKGRESWPGLREVVEFASKTGQPIFWSGDLKPQANGIDVPSLFHLMNECKSAVVLPLKNHSAGPGCLFLGSKERSLGLEDFVIADEVAQRAAVALENAALFASVAQAQAEIRNAQVAAETANQAKSLFLANMSHEIRTPLSAILGFTDLILAFAGDSSLPETAERVAEWGLKIKTNGEHLRQIIEEILDLSKVESGRMQMAIERTSLCGAFIHLLNNLRPVAERKGLRLDVQLQGEIPAVIETDATRFKQIVLNVVGNAIKFTEHGQVEVVLEHLAEQEHLSVRVRDSGVGLTEAQAARIFAPFTQADPSHTRRFGGTGLGLSLSRKLARNLGGDVKLVASEPGIGSEFVILVATGNVNRVAKMSKGYNFNEASVVPLAPAAPVVKGLLKGVRVLLAEDSPDNRHLLGLFLEKAGAEITTAVDGKEALEKGLTTTADLILMDVQMPIMNGYEVTQRLREAGVHRPIFALTAHAQAEEREHSFRAGCNEHVAKPVNFQELISLIARYTNPH